MACLLGAALSVSGCAGAHRKSPTPIEFQEASRSKLDEAYAFMNEDQKEKTVLALEDALYLDPQNGLARMELAYLYLMAGRLSEARKQLQRVVKQDGEYKREALEQLEVLKDMDRPQEALSEAAIKGYEALRHGKRDQARRIFEAAVERDPGDLLIQKQLGYMNLQEKRLEAAAKNFEWVRRVTPENYSASLELGYIYEDLRDMARAEEAFRTALRSPDKKIRDQAGPALKNILASRRPVFDLYASPFYAGRFNNQIHYLQGQLSWKPFQHGPLNLYWGNCYSRDSRSHSGPEGQIFADNVLLSGLGARLQAPQSNLHVAVESNLAFNLTRSAEHPGAAEKDIRAFLGDYRYWGNRFFAEAGGSLGFYSRYSSNIIAMFNLRTGWNIRTGPSSQWSFYFPFGFLKDKNHDFYNNLLEKGFGVEFQPWTWKNFKLRAETVLGSYLKNSGRDPNPYEPRYQDSRVMLVYSERFVAGL